MVKLKNSFVFLLLVFSLLISIFISTSVGSVSIPIKNILKIIVDNLPLINSLVTSQYEKSHEIIVMNLRLPRVILGVLVGVSLSISGAVMQGLFKNPMASPFVLGISSGASMGAALSIVLLPFIPIRILSFITSLLTVFLVYRLAKSGKKTPIATLLLIGLAVGAFFSGLTSFLMYISGRNLQKIVFWIMGSLGASSWNDVSQIALVILIGFPMVYYFSRDLNILQLGEEQAKHLGVEVERTKKIVLVLTALLTSIAVSVSGIIGFIGLIVPHMIRMILGPDHKILIPSSALLGGIILIWSDTIARTIIAPSELPVGIITELLGAPFFIYLAKKKGSDMW